MATPIVAGIAGLLLLQEPDLSVPALRDRLLLTSDPTLYTEVDDNIYYYPRVLGEPNPVPLLGTGIVNAKNTILNNTEGGGRPHRTIKRVNSACSTIAGQRLALELNWFYFIMPWISALIWRYRH